MALDQIVNRGYGRKTGALEDLGALTAVDSRHFLGAFDETALHHANQRRVVESVDLEVGENRPAGITGMGTLRNPMNLVFRMPSTVS